MASFSISNQSSYQKHVIEKAFQSLLEESMRFECPSIIKKFSNTSDLNLSTVRADLFTSMKMNQNTKKWRKELRKQSKIAQKLNHSKQVSGYQLNPPGFHAHQESQVSTSDSRHLKMPQSSSQPYVWKPSFVSGTKSKKHSDNEFVIPDVSNNPPPSVVSKKKTNKVRTVSGVANEMDSLNVWSYKTKVMPLSQQMIQVDQNHQPKVVLEKFPVEWTKDGCKMKPVGSKKDKRKDNSNQKKNYTFDQWIFRIDENKDIFVKGHLSGSPANVFWSTSEIIKRIDNKTLLTASGKLCILEGSIMEKALISKGYPAGLIKKFSHGFPFQWKSILSSKQIPKIAIEKKAIRNQTIKREHIEEEEGEEDEDEEDDDDDDDKQQEDEEEEAAAAAGSEEDNLPENKKLSTIKENSKTLSVSKKEGNDQDYLFNIFSSNPRMDFPETDPCPLPVSNVTKKISVKNKKQVKEELGKKVVSSKNPVRSQYMTRSLTSHLKGKSAQPPKSALSPNESQKSTKIIPKYKTSRKQPTAKKNDDECYSPHPLSNTINVIPANADNKKVSDLGKKTSRAKKSSPAKSGKVDRPRRQKVSQTKTQGSRKQKSQKPSVNKKQSHDAQREACDAVPSKKVAKKEKDKESGRKMIKDWTNEEVKKLLTAMSTVPKTDRNFWKKVARKVGRSAEECTNYYCSCDLSSLDWKDLKKKDEKKEVPNIIKRKNLHIYDVSDSYEDDLFESENFLGNTKKIRLNEDCHLDDIFADLSVKTPSLSDQNFHTPMSKFFLTPVSERQTPASSFSDGDIKIDWDNADRCVKEFKKQQKKGAGRLKMPKKLAELKSEFKPKSLQLGSIVDELNKINNIPKKSDKEDEAEDSNINLYFSSESED